MPLSLNPHQQEVARGFLTPYHQQKTGMPVLVMVSYTEALCSGKQDCYQIHTLKSDFCLPETQISYDWFPFGRDNSYTPGASLNLLSEIHDLEQE